MTYCSVHRRRGLHVSGLRERECERVVVSNIMESISAASVRIDDATVRRLSKVRYNGPEPTPGSRERAATGTSGRLEDTPVPGSKALSA